MEKRGNNMYWILYVCMIVGFGGLAMSTPDPKLRIIGILLTIVNGLLYFKSY